MQRVTYSELGDRDYRVFGPGFVAEVHIERRGDRSLCSVRSCDNHAINAWDIQMWCEKNIH